MRTVGLINRLSIIILATILGCHTKTSAQDRLLHYKTKNGQAQPIKTKKHWEQKRTQILQSMQDVMGPLPIMPKWTPEIRFLDTLHTAHYTRYTIHLTVEKNEIVPALLYFPKAQPVSGKYPAALVLHSTGAGGKHLVDSLSAGPYRAIATELVHRGYIVLAPDYPGFGDLADHDFSKDRYASGTMQGIFNHMRCIDYLQSRPDVHKEKMGVIGHSLGGHNAIFLGAFDPRAKVVISSCGWTLMEYYNAGDAVTQRFGGKLGPWAQDRYMPIIRDKYNMDAKLLPFDFDEIIAAIAPRYFFSCSPLKDDNFNLEGVRAGIKQATTIYTMLNAGNNIQADYPNAGHDFPEESKKKAYELMDRVLQ